MLEELIQPFDFKSMIVEPWSVDFANYFTIVLMGFLISLSCGLVGNFLIVRRMALVGDAISHSLLPGIALAFLFTSTLALPVMVVGAIIAGVVTTVLIEFIHRKSRVKTDAALGIVFTASFAFGVILISLFADRVHLDADCVLYGELEYLNLDAPVILHGFNLGPLGLVQMACVTVEIILLVCFFYKELVVTSFDPGLAKSLGINVNAFHYGLMAVLSIVIVSSFESVGVILAIAMLIFPGVTASMVSDRLPVILWLTVPLSLLYSIGGLHLALWLGCSISGAMVVVAGFFFCLLWLFSPRRGIIRYWRKKRVDIANIGDASRANL